MKSVCVLILFSCLSLSSQAAAPLNFERDILPTLRESCFKCHKGGKKKPKAGLRLDHAEEIKNFENLIVPGYPEKSSLYELIALPKGHDDIMPPEGKAPVVNKKNVAKVKLWIEQGAHFANWREHKENVKVKLTSGLGKKTIETDIQKASTKIDQLVQSILKKNKLSYNSSISDEVFLRRVSLNIIGRIPNLSETNKFLKDPSKNKRLNLVRTLQSSEGYISHNFNYWADVLRAQTIQEGNAEDNWLLFIKDSIRQNKPYDKWVNEMVSANGTFWENQAIGFYRRDANNRLAGYEALTGVFLGKQIGC
ncbi:MAG: DUF1549 domain-containing protein, partial [Lentisphaeraceae bacterium]|nr:DUF1549 domain-containing protein [Lentisphaeraceae bacterium]